MSDVLFVASDYKPRPGGIAAYIDTLARGLIDLGKNVKVLAVVDPSEKERVAFLNSYEDWAIPFEVIHDERPKSWLGNKLVSLLEILRCLSPRTRRALEKTSIFRASADSIKRLEKVLAREQPTTVVFGHLDLNLYPFALALLERRVPYGIIAHDREVLPFRNKKNDLIRRGMMLRGAQWIAANSRHTKSLVELWGIPFSRIKILHPPISEGAIAARVDSQHICKTRTELNIVSVCRLFPSKGIDTVIRALSLLDKRKLPFRYVIGGDGPEKRWLEALVDESGLRSKVSFMGYITEDHKWRLLRDSDVFVMPSRVDPETYYHEGFGIAFLEAAALGVPGIGSNLGGIPDAVIDGETGILIPHDSPQHLADALAFLYSNPEKRREMGRAGRERARRQFSATAIAAQFQEEILQSVLTDTADTTSIVFSES